MTDGRADRGLIWNGDRINAVNIIKHPSASRLNNSPLCQRYVVHRNDKPTVIISVSGCTDVGGCIDKNSTEGGGVRQLAAEEIANEKAIVLYWVYSAKSTFFYTLRVRTSFGSEMTEETFHQS